MSEIYFKNRETGSILKEKVYGKFFLEALYGNRFLSLTLLHLISKIPIFSKWYGKCQKSSSSKKKIVPFIENYQVDQVEFLQPVEQFSSFNDFFIRKLKPESRPLASGDDIAILPADGRYLVFPDISRADGFYVKGKKFDLGLLLKDESLFEIYNKGSLMISRLCPVDYHRFHFPFDCVPSISQKIKGTLYSVNPIALRKSISILNENKREITCLKTERFGDVLYMEVGATYVGSIKQTYTPHIPYKKGEEKGYFEFGGSCVILLFQPGTITFDQDLIDSSEKQIEVMGKMGQSLGKSQMMKSR